MNLDQLRRQAKELRDASRRDDSSAHDRIERVASGLNGPASLAIAQLVIAREQGFASWPRLKAAADAESADLARFLDVSINGPAGTAVSMLREHPRLAESPHAAAVLGDADGAVAASTAVDERGWTPLMYACYSRWHRHDPSRSAALTATAQALLDAGAGPNTHNGRLPNQGYQSALLGAVVSDKPEVVALLISRGAYVDDRVSLHTAAELRHHRCLQLLVEHGATIERTWALGAAVFARDAWAVRLLLDAIRDAGGEVAARAGEQLEDAASAGSVEVVEALLAAGADPSGRADLVRTAVRAGAVDTAVVLERYVGPADIAPVDRLIGACHRLDRAEALLLARELGGPPVTLSTDDTLALVEAAGRAKPDVIALMLDVGWPVEARDPAGETALHNAAYHGQVSTVRLLLERGAPVDVRDDRFEATPLAFATVGSRERRHDADANGDWTTTARALLDAGASHEDVWLSGDKAPSDEVADVLRSYGLHSESAPPAGPDVYDIAAPEGSLADVAALLRIAFDTTDLDLFASLLSPDVRWGAGPLGCSNREQVIAQYRQSVDLGFHGTIAAVEVYDEQTLIVELRYVGASQDMPPAAPGSRVQVLRVVDDLIVSIDGFSDLDSARRAAAVR